MFVRDKITADYVESYVDTLWRYNLYSIQYSTLSSLRRVVI